MSFSGAGALKKTKAEKLKIEMKKTKAEKLKSGKAEMISVFRDFGLSAFRFGL
jgi:hypothetical protein